MQLNADSALAMAAAVCAAGLAVFAWLRERFSAVRLAFVAGMMALAAERLCLALSALSASPEAVLQWQRLGALAAALLPGSWILFAITYSRADYRRFLNRSRILIATAFLVPLGMVALFGQDLVLAPAGLRAPASARLELGPTGLALQVMLMFAYVVVLMNLEKTLRTAVGTMRWRIKFMVMGLGLIFVIRVFTGSQTLLYSSISLPMEQMNDAAVILGSALTVRSLLRAHLLDVDLYLSPSILSHSLTVVVAGIYLLLVGIMAEFVADFGGAAALPLKNFLLLLAIAGVSVVLLSDRAQQWSRRFVSRHLRRPQYDYRQVWSRFTEQTVSMMSAADFCRAAVKLVSGTLEALSVTVWLIDTLRDALTFGGSTSLSESDVRDLPDLSGRLPALKRTLLASPHPFNLNESREDWAEPLKRANPDVFRRGAERICVPLVAGGELLAVMILTDRVSSQPYTTEEFDLLKTLGDQMAASLLNLQLSERLLESKEMEAFQSMSAFFVHDLKNTASTLSLLLQNLPRHFHDPAFREDALQAVSKSVNRINDLIQRLNLLRRQPEEQRKEGDLNAVVSLALAEVGEARGARVAPQLAPVPPCLMASDQIQKVVVNLVINALEATHPDGAVHVSTRAEDGWLVLTVRDNGCGIPREFLRRFLFHPFRSTKPKGIGVGLFQCKTVVEAHGGKIEVESEEGKGTTFRVLLPAHGGKR